MPKRLSKKEKPKDINELATFIVESTTGTIERVGNDKNPHAVALGRLGGLKGGVARAIRLTPAERSEIARKAAQARWGKA